MLNTSKIQQVLQNNWIIAAFLLAIFLLANGYTYAWDDQHVEIPLLKSLIDPELYPGDYYVTSLKKNFTSVLYPILARMVTIDQIPAAYFTLYLLSRYFFFYWMYRFWLLIAQKKREAVACVLTVILLVRVEEFLYRTFSHQEFALAVIMAGFYFFYKDRFYLAALLWGVAANFHALYSLFPMLYMLFFLGWEYQKFGVKKFLSAGIIFTLSATPFIIWTIEKYITAPPTAAVDPNWIPLYRLACPQNFIFLEITLPEMMHSLQKFIAATDNYFVLILLFILNNFFNDTFRQDKKTKSILITAAILLVVSFIFSYLLPVRFILDLNLVRNGQYMLFILGGYTALLVLRTLGERSFLIGLLLVVIFTLLRFGDTVGALAVLIMVCLMGYAALNKDNKVMPRTVWHFALIILTAVILFILTKHFVTQNFSRIAIRSLQIIAGLLTAAYLAEVLLKDQKKMTRLKQAVIFIPYLLLLINYGYYHYKHLEIERHAGGFWQLQRNWIDLQHFVKNSTPKNALFLIPHDMEMGGFRIFSERPVVIEYRDCGIVGFDYAAAVEWLRRLNDVEPFKVIIDGPIEPVIKKAINDYKVNYIVFMKYLNLKNNPFMEEVYGNDVFTLYEIKINPVVNPVN